MTNRENYLFDYFTVANYKSLLQLAKDKKFEFISFEHEFEAHSKQILNI